MKALVEVAEARGEHAALVVNRSPDGLITLVMGDTAGRRVTMNFVPADWNEFLRVCNADAAEFQWDRGPYVGPARA